MRIFWICFALILIGLVGYAYTKNPAGCMKVISDIGDVFTSISPVKVEIKNGTAVITSNSSANTSNNAPAEETAPPPPPPAPSPIPAPSSAPPPPPSNLDANVSGLVPTLLNGNLVSAGGAPYEFPASAPLSSIRYFAIYYAAAWSPACPTFTSQLVQWYNNFKPAHPHFEVIFVSEDHDADSQRVFMQETNMPWPAMRFGAIKHDGNGTFQGSGIEQYANTGIPDLVLVDQTGKVLLDSYQNGNYVGPEQVMNQIPGFVSQ